MKITITTATTNDNDGNRNYDIKATIMVAVVAGTMLQTDYDGEC